MEDPPTLKLRRDKSRIDKMYGNRFTDRSRIENFLALAGLIWFDFWWNENESRQISQRNAGFWIKWPIANPIDDTQIQITGRTCLGQAQCAHEHKECKRLTAWVFQLCRPQSPDIQEHAILAHLRRALPCRLLVAQRVDGIQQ